MLGIFDRFSNILDPVAVAARKLGFSCEIYDDLEGYKRSCARLVLFHGTEDAWHRVVYSKKIDFSRAFVRTTTIGFPKPPAPKLVGTNIYLFHLTPPVDKMSEEDWFLLIPYMLEMENWKRLLEGNSNSSSGRFFSPQRVFKQVGVLSLLCQVYLVVWSVDSRDTSGVVEEALESMGERLLRGELRIEVNNSARNRLEEVSRKEWWISPLGWTDKDTAHVDLETELEGAAPDVVLAILELVDAIYLGVNRKSPQFADTVAAAYMNIVKMARVS